MVFVVKVAPGLQLYPGSSGLRANLGRRRADLVQVGRQFASNATTGVPLTFYAFPGPPPTMPTYQAPTIPPDAPKVQQAERLAAAIDGILKLHHQNFPPIQKAVLLPPPSPDYPAILRRRTSDALSRVSIFRRSTRKAAKAAAVRATQMECDELARSRQTQHNAVNHEIDQLWRRLISNDPDVVLAVLSNILTANAEAVVPIGVWDSEAHLAAHMPDPETLPDRHPTTTAAGNVSLKKFTKAEGADLYKQLVAGLLLTTTKQAFAVAPSLRTIRMVALRKSPHNAFGHDRREALLAASFTRDRLNGVRWRAADAGTILQGISDELLIRTAGPSKTLAPLDLKTEPYIARLLDAANSAPGQF